MNVYSATNIGLKRLENQDRVKTYSFDKDAAFAVICDGMGGENAGSEASQKAVAVIYDRITKIFKPDFNDNMVKNLFFSAVATANAVVFDLAISSASMQGMGTTCVAAIRNKSKLYIMSVGDSRAYIIDSEIKQVTKDHTVVMKMYENGEITKDELKSHPKRNYITKAVGVWETIEPDYFELEIKPDSAVLICSDGLSNYCEDNIIHEIVTKNIENEIADELIKAALKYGGSDNITVAIIK